MSQAIKLVFGEHYLIEYGGELYEARLYSSYKEHDEVTTAGIIQGDLTITFRLGNPIDTVSKFKKLAYLGV